MRRRLCFAALLALSTAACEREPREARLADGPDTALPQAEAHEQRGAHGSHGVADDIGVVDVPADLSIYHLESEWTDASGATRPLGASLGGRIQVVALVYTSCAFACPAVVGDMKRIAAAVGGTGFTLVSIDPARDTPERLRVFAEGSRLDAGRWTLLTAGDDELLELAAVLGVRYRRISETDFMHSNVLTVLDEDGRIVHRQIGLGRVETTIAAIRRELEG